MMAKFVLELLDGSERRKRLKVSGKELAKYAKDRGFLVLDKVRSVKSLNGKDVECLDVVLRVFELVGHEGDLWTFKERAQL